MVSGVEPRHEPKQRGRAVSPDIATAHNETAGPSCTSWAQGNI